MILLTRLAPPRSLLRVHNIRWLVISRFFTDLFFYSTTIVLFQEQRGLNYTQMFLMESILSATIWFTELPTSVLADRFGYRRMLILGRAVGVAGMLVYVFARGFWLFALSNALAGLAFACVSGVESALAYHSLTAEQREQQGSEAFALLGVATSAGSFLGLFTGSFFGAYSPTLAAAASLPPMLMALLAALRLHARPSPTAQPERATPARAPAILRGALRSVRAQPWLILLAAFNSLAFAQENAIFWYNQPYFARAGIAVSAYGPLMSAAVAVQMLLLARLGAIRRVLGTRLLLGLSALLPGLAYLLLARAYMPVPVVLLVTGVVAFSGWRAPLVEHALNRRIPDAHRATTLSALSLTGALAKAALDPAIGFLGDHGLVVTGVGLGLGLVALGGLALLLRPKAGQAA